MKGVLIQGIKIDLLTLEIHLSPPNLSHFQQILLLVFILVANMLEVPQNSKFSIFHSKAIQKSFPQPSET